MSSRRPTSFRNTLAFRLTVWYAAILTISACIVFLLFYALFASFILDQTDQELKSQADRFSILLTSEGSGSVEQSSLIESHAAGIKKVFFRFLSVNGEVFSSSDLSYWRDIDIGLDETAVKELVREGQPVFKTIRVSGRKENVRVLYALLSPRMILQIGVAMESYARFLEAFQKMFVATMAFLIVLAAGGGWFMARRAVSGIEAVTRTAQKIIAGTLEERVPINPRGDEIDTLALSFNQMLDRIRALLKEIEEMTDNIAHDLRSPITRIRGTAEIALTTGRNVDEYESMAASTIEECDRLLNMINTMLLISRTESGVDRKSGSEMDLTGVVQKACELFQPAAEDKNIELCCSVPSGIRVVGDTPMIQRMITNLLDNAIKYSPSGGKVQVDVHETESQVFIVFRDSGIGISTLDLPHIFDRFYRCDRSRSQTGVGLGLSLARSIARAHQGDISVTSMPDQGSTFTVHMPKSL